MKIVSASGTNFFVTGDVEPSSNVGPWLRGGTQWFVFDEVTKRYVPLDITASEKTWYFMGNSTPPGTNPPVWLKTTKDPSDADPSFGNAISWYEFNGAEWLPFVGTVLSGTTAQRPAAPVPEFQQFYDTDITALIWFERTKWRTVSGVPGDLKYVAYEVLTDALEANPGWALFGSGNTSFRGRVISMATKDPGATPETDLTTDPLVPHRASFETFGEGTPILTGASATTIPPQIALWLLVKE